ncbi:MFS general substrate transporter [Phellopilus nigrolimitatus]|nr:MFS general substrate transporter [Phellopilus nigrolimitatus]
MSLDPNPPKSSSTKDTNTSATIVTLDEPASEATSDAERVNASGLETQEFQEEQTQMPFKLYKRRFTGVLGIIALNIVAGMNLPWFGPIANDTADAFGISLDQVNWLGNIIAVTYLVVAPLVPILCSRVGIRVCYVIGTTFLILSAWVRFAGTARALSPRGAYALLIIGQFLSAIPQVTFQVLAPKFSETWFDVQGRTTATMLMSVSNPVGTALGQLISPLVSTPRDSVLVLGIISTAVSPFVLLVGSKPPTPPSYSGSQISPTFLVTLRGILGLLPRPISLHAPELDHGAVSVDQERQLESPSSPISPASAALKAEETQGSVDVRNLEPRAEHEHIAVNAYMTPRERVDFSILFLVFGVLVAGVSTFSLLSDELLEPYGYSDDTAGFMGAALLFSGLLAAFITSPLFDRVLTRHLGLAARAFAPLVAAAWLALIWAVRPHNTGALYALFVIIGVFSLSILPVGLELGCELTRNSGASSAILWSSGNLFGIIFILVMSALRAPASASPPGNMHRSLVFVGVFIFAATMSIFFFRGHQRRLERDMRVAANTAPVRNSEAELHHDQLDEGGFELRHRARGSREFGGR